MTDTTTPKKKRKPSGAAVPGAVDRPKHFPRQLVVMATDALADRIADDAKRNGLSKSEVARLYLEAGIEAADQAKAEAEANASASAAALD